MLGKSTPQCQRRHELMKWTGNNGHTDSESLASRRHAMVEKQIRQRHVTDHRVLACLQRVPRHEFVPAEFRDRAYDDSPLPTGDGQTISQPYIVAAMTA